MLRPRHSSLLLALVLLLPAAHATAAPSVAPGETLVFSGADDGSRECRIEDSSRNCDNPRWREGVLGTATGFDVAANEVRAIIDPTVGIGVGAANHASASVFNDFDISGPGGGVVAAHISVTYDYEGLLSGAAAYTADNKLNLVISDITGGAPGVVIGSHGLAAQERSGDQGVTDISAGGQSANLNGEGSGFHVLLRRGRSYRITFQASAGVVALLVGRPLSNAQARWSDLRVSLDEDEVELLEAHDFDMKALLATHDEDVKDAIRQHDADIKALLEHLEEGQEEIIRLLLTPQGRRSSDFGSCSGDGCDFPLKPGGDSGQQNPSAGSPPPGQASKDEATGSAGTKSWWQQGWGSGSTQGQESEDESNDSSTTKSWWSGW